MVCDLQERFAPDPSSTSSTSSAIRSASSRRLPLGRTRLSDRAVSLGPTVEPLKSLVLTQPVAKTKFSMLVPEVDERLDQLKAARFTDTVVLCDIETHVCVVATCIDLIHRGYNVVADAVSSRTMTDQKFALERMKVIGAHVTTTEAIVLAMVADAAHPHFKAIQKLIKDLTPDTELV